MILALKKKQYSYGKAHRGAQKISVIVPKETKIEWFEN